MSDFDFEPVPGLPEHLPAGEKMLWQGAPNWMVLAREAFHVRKVAIYFAILLIWSVASAVSEGRTAIALSAFLWLFAFAAVSIGILMVLAWGTARTTIYTITSRRVVIRYGIALPMTINLPFQALGGVSLKINADGTGDIPMSLAGRDRVAWLVMWPHVRPWRMSNPEPMLRAIPDAKQVGATLAGAMQAAAEFAPAPAAVPRASEVQISRPAIVAMPRGSAEGAGGRTALAS